MIAVNYVYSMVLTLISIWLCCSVCCCCWWWWHPVCVSCDRSCWAVVVVTPCSKGVYVCVLWQELLSCRSCDTLYMCVLWQELLSCGSCQKRKIASSLLQNQCNMTTLCRHWQSTRRQQNLSQQVTTKRECLNTEQLRLLSLHVACCAVCSLHSTGWHIKHSLLMPNTEA